VPGDVLRMIEDASNEDPIQLQSGFTAYDDCSSIRINYEGKYGPSFNEFIFSLFVDNDDECVTASEIYSCGREKEPSIVNVIFNSEKGNATLVCNLDIITRSSISEMYTLYSQYDPPVPCMPIPRIRCQFTKSAPACLLNVNILD
jgi:hypothetical protein